METGDLGPLAVSLFFRLRWLPPVPLQQLEELEQLQQLQQLRQLQQLLAFPGVYIHPKTSRQLKSL